MCLHLKPNILEVMMLAMVKYSDYCVLMIFYRQCCTKDTEIEVVCEQYVNSSGNLADLAEKSVNFVQFGSPKLS